MPETLDFLRQDHRNMATLLRILERQVGEFRSGKRPDYDVISAILKYFVSFPNAYHHPREDLVFARLRDRDPFAADRIGDLRSAHKELAARAQEFLGQGAARRPGAHAAGAAAGRHRLLAPDLVRPPRPDRRISR